MRNTDDNLSRDSHNERENTVNGEKESVETLKMYAHFEVELVKLNTSYFAGSTEDSLVSTQKGTSSICFVSHTSLACKNSCVMSSAALEGLF